MGIRLLLINTNTMKPPIAPIGLEYVGEYLASEGIDVRTFDFSFEDDLEEKIALIKPDFVGLGIRNTDDCTFPAASFFLPEIRRIIDRIKRSTNVPIVCGGVGFSVMPEGVLDFLDLKYGIHGDGEENLLAFIRNYPDVKDIPNLVRREDGGIVNNETKYFDLDKLAPRRKLFRNRDYYEQGGMGSVETKRGCVMQCVYCADPLSKGRKIRLRPPESVADEVLSLSAQGINKLHFCDSEFNLPREHAVAVCRKFIKKGIQAKAGWYTYCSPKGFDGDLSGLFKKAGCLGINFGVDSGSDRILKALGRDYTRGELLSTGKACRDAGLPFMFDLMFGSPGEDEKSITETMETMKEIRPDVVGCAVGVRIYPGTVIHDLIRKKSPELFVGNDSCIKPVFYLEPGVKDTVFPLIKDLAAGDKRFILSAAVDEHNYNYNQNQVLIDEIRTGKRGAYWDILRQIM
ncbi:MAG: radical SAM protein [Spirochaetales bacterium]|nr:radical SAM protein [Spirochaetales bacterium]